MHKVFFPAKRLVQCFLDAVQQECLSAMNMILLSLKCIHIQQWHLVCFSLMNLVVLVDIILSLPSNLCLCHRKCWIALGTSACQYAW